MSMPQYPPLDYSKLPQGGSQHSLESPVHPDAYFRGHNAPVINSQLVYTQNPAPAKLDANEKWAQHANASDRSLTLEQIANAPIVDPSDTRNVAQSSGMGFTEGSSIGFHNVTYTVKVKDPDTKKMIDRNILTNCTGSIQPGTLNAIMGASGGGKTSLLDVLADRKDAGTVQGTILVDGAPRDSESFKHNSGYVVQDDIVMGTLTVRENLMFSAELRLPGTISYDEKQRRVQNVIDELGLNKVAESKVGNEFIRGISGGERKRVNIGMELITSPSVLFLDEPTTGLDATTSSQVLALLKRLARHGRTIILSIHQPRFKIFDMFDTLTLLSDGNFVYHGPASGVIPYFDSVGFPCGEHNNPADYILDVVSGGEAPQGEKDAPMDCEDVSERRRRTRALQERLWAQYQQSPFGRKAYANFEHERTNRHQHVSRNDFKGTYAASWLTQVAVTSKRAFKNVVRNPATSIGQVMVNIFVGVLVGCIFYRLDEQQDVQRIVRDRTGFLFFVSINLMFSNMSALEIFLKERVIFMHEKASGYYRVSAYFVSKLICDMVPVRILPTAVFCCVVYFMAGMQRDAGKFGWFLLTAELQSMCAASVCFLFSSLISVFAIANLSVTLFYVLMMIFSGLLVSINSWPDSSRWVGYLSFTKYSYELFVENEFMGLSIPCKNPGEPCTGEEVLAKDVLDVPDLGEKWKKIIALLIYTLGLLTLGYLALLRLKKRN
eukprot:CAMPEP_0174917844 /NCGR_PEP_ID=MMETSP1355-20121228/2719_1 /TAXON_ID=464990 /ORGANISM="Hemiselmis tepida, Strain CCMP443" /LENGTH=719 /DNA_ID=CAMNT_0016162981 /DNA_START=34 /DNA_END=2193 /DNA_ORIENTATION=-